MIALVGATAGEPGVVVIAGTGSIAFGKNSAGRTARAGGWGYALGDEGVAGRDAAEGPLVEGERVGVAEVVVEPPVVDAALMQKDLGNVQPGEGLDLGMWKVLALKALPGEGGVDDGEVATPLQFACKLEVVKDAEDCLGDLHGLVHPSAKPSHLLGPLVFAGLGRLVEDRG